MTDYEKIRDALDILKNTVIEGEAVFFNPKTWQIWKGKVPHREGRIVAMDELNQPQNRKQRRVKARKERRKNND